MKSVRRCDRRRVGASGRARAAHSQPSEARDDGERGVLADLVDEPLGKASSESERVRSIA